MTAFYNEIDPYAAQWLRNLIAAGHIAPGVVDERSIADIEPAELAWFTQCHFFAGIGVWSYALRLAGWPDDRPVWTGSCPCQPFSGAGAGKGHEDERHLWPTWQRLIRVCKPSTVFGEQVAGPAGLGWLDVVLSDLENDSYSVGAVDFPAAGVGAPHIRQRLYFVADSADSRHERRRASQESDGQHAAWIEPERLRIAGFVGDTEHKGLEGHAGHGDGARGWPAAVGSVAETSISRWSGADWIACRDGKKRPVEPGTFPLAHGAPARVGRLRAYGNAINAQAARAFIEAADMPKRATE